MPSLVEHLAQRPKEANRFLRSLIRALLTDRVHTSASFKLLGDIVNNVELGDLAQAVAQQLLTNGPDAEGEELQTLLNIFRWTALPCISGFWDRA